MSRPADDPATDYARDVLAGRVAAGRLVRLACERHLRDLETGPARGLRWDAVKAQRAIDFFGFLRHSKGEWGGRPFVLTPWQAFVVGCVFGWLRANGTRRFRVAYVEIPRKNGKSTLAAGVGLYLLVADGEPGAEVYTAATMRDQARIVHGEAIRMVRKSAGLSKRVSIFKDNLNVPATESKYTPLGADADTLDGLNPHGLLIDELHAHKSRKMWDVLDTATGSRRQPLLFAITTAGFDRTSVCYEQRSYAERVLAGVIPDDTFFAFVAAPDDGDDWTKEATWRKANPNWGVSVKPDDFAEKCRRAQDSAAAQNAFMRLRLNLWTEQEVRWLDLARWDAGGAPFDPAELKGAECYGGLDLANSLDLAALSLVFPRDGGRYRLLWWFWVPRERLRERERRNQTRLDAWVQQGYIKATPGDTIDHDVIEADVEALAQEYLLRKLAYDPFNAEQAAQHLAQAGIPMVKFPQSMGNFNEPTREFERLVVAGQLEHGGNPVARWMASNVTVVSNAAGNLMPSRKRSLEKIDGIVAGVMALGEAMLRPDQQSVYDTRGVLTLTGEEAPAPAAGAAEALAPAAASGDNQPVRWGGDWGDDDD